MFVGMPQLRYPSLHRLESLPSDGHLYERLGPTIL